jgi:thymidylate synthase (FAD)
MSNSIPSWLVEHREGNVYDGTSNAYYNTNPQDLSDAKLTDLVFNKHSVNDGEHVSPYDQNTLHVGTAGLRVELVKAPNFEVFKSVLSSATRATVGIDPHAPGDERDWEEMMKGGLQGALESDTIVFRIYNASRALTHQLVRTRNAAFNQQSQRATFYGDRPDVRMPLSVYKNPRARAAFEKAVAATWDAYRIACEEDISYQDARFVLVEGTVNFIQCTYTVREFINVYAYRACSMFMWEMVEVMRLMRAELVGSEGENHWLAPYVKISCEKTGSVCQDCNGKGEVEGKVAYDKYETITCHTCFGQGRIGAKCTFQGWESPEGQCDKPWAKDEQRSFKPLFHTIGRRPGMDKK